MTGDSIIEMACAGNKDAERFCRSWTTFCHTIDDIHDKDKPVTIDAIVAALVSYTMELAGNPFFQAHKAQLIGLMIQGANAWLDSNAIPQSGEVTIQKDGTLQHKSFSQPVRDVLKSSYQEVVWHTAFIVGGWEHLRKVTQECREFDFENSAPPIATDLYSITGLADSMKGYGKTP